MLSGLIFPTPSETSLSWPRMAFAKLQTFWRRKSVPGPSSASWNVAASELLRLDTVGKARRVTECRAQARQIAFSIGAVGGLERLVNLSWVLAHGMNLASFQITVQLAT
jgi:hypothetical protein